MKVEIVEYDPEWPLLFKKLKSTYMDELGELIIDVEHIGSTSVPGLCAKPSIDIDIVISERSVLPSVIQGLSRIGYTHSGDQGIEGREAFKRKDSRAPHDGSESSKYPHHLYVCSCDSMELKKHLFFREYLRLDPEMRNKYGELKKSLAEKYRKDRVAYTEAKTEFIQNILKELL
ncbi:MAG: GrpB family protein [Thermoplasmata archaeon]